VPSDGTCVLKRAALNKEKLVKLLQWSNILDSNMTSKLCLLINPFLKLNKSAKIFICLPNYVCLLESHKKFEKIKRLWLLCVKVCFKSLMIELNRFVSLIWWFQKVKRSNNGVSTSLFSLILLKLKCSRDLKFLNHQILPLKLQKVINNNSRTKFLMEAHLVHWTTQTI